MGANVDSSIDTEIFKLDYLWFFYNTPEANMAFSAGLNVSKIETAIAGELVVGEPISVEQVNVNVTAPLPVIGLTFTYDPLPKLSLIFQHSAFLVNYDKYEGSWIDTSLLAEYRFWRNIGIGGGFNYNALNLKAKDDDSKRRLDLRNDIGAVQLYLFFNSL